MHNFHGVDDAAINDLKAKAPAFMRRLETMRADAARSGNQEARDMVDYGDSLKSVIEGFTGAIDTAGSILDSIKYGLTHPFGYALPGFNGMGFLPAMLPSGVLALTAITGAAVASVAVTYFITKADRVHSDIIASEWQNVQARADELRASGDTAGAQKVIDDFNKVQATTAPQSALSNISSIASSIMIIGIVYMILRGRK